MCSGDQSCFVLVGRETEVVFKSEPPLCYAVNEYFYLLIIQLPLDVWTIAFVYFCTSDAVFSECNWQGVDIVSQFGGNRLLYVRLFVY